MKPKPETEHTPKLRPSAAKSPKRNPIPPPRVIIDRVRPEIDGGRFPIKRTIGELVEVQADIFAEGHDVIAAVVQHRLAGTDEWSEIALIPEGNDAWHARFLVDRVGRQEYTVYAWVDHFATWARDLVKRRDAGQDLSSELLEGAQLVRDAASRASSHQREWLESLAARVGDVASPDSAVAAALDPDLAAATAGLVDRKHVCMYERILSIQVERERARFGAWYEMFPRSAANEPGRHGTFRDVEARLPYVASMGFDVLYLPPIHPIGRAFRKGPNNSLTPGPDDPGSPWAIGAAEGGHTAILPDLGTLEDFDHLVEAARNQRIEIALDIAFQCSPDHPWVKDHPTWFRQRPDGTIKYAENPPKKYQDIYPINFETPDWQELWSALRDVFLFWTKHGVNVFRVDNPHTKALPFWEWCLREVWDRCPSAIFLSEAFTRPKIMKYLAKAGFTQSYTYFTWRNDKQGLTDYLTELTTTECAEYMRPNFFANTPDILHEFLQTSGRAGFALRLVLAATLGATYGIYGPPFEQCVGTPVRHGSEEYLDSEKYQVRHWNLNEPHSLRPLVARVNAIRREHHALHFTRNLQFFHVENPSLIAYGKIDPDGRELILVVVNLDPHHTQSGWLRLPLHELRLQHADDGGYELFDLLNDARYTWHGHANFVMLNPHETPAHIFKIARREGY